MSVTSQALPLTVCAYIIAIGCSPQKALVSEGSTTRASPRNPDNTTQAAVPAPARSSPSADASVSAAASALTLKMNDPDLKKVVEELLGEAPTAQPKETPYKNLTKRSSSVRVRTRANRAPAYAREDRPKVRVNKNDREPEAENFVTPNEASELTTEQEEAEFSCFARPNRAPASTPVINSSLDDPNLVPDWMEMSVALTARRGCVERGLRIDCTPQVFRNDGIANAAFSFRDNKIRYNYSYIMSQMSVVGEGKRFVAFVLGVLAHEYGHFLDAKLRVYGDFVNSIPQLSTEVLTMIQKKELFADSVAGCILSVSGLSTQPMETFFAGLAWTAAEEHPRPELRQYALNAGWTRCSRMPISSSVVSALLTM